eukprot:g9888.t1
MHRGALYTDLGDRPTNALSYWTHHYVQTATIDFAGDDLTNIVRIGDKTTTFLGSYEENGFEVLNWRGPDVGDDESLFGAYTTLEWTVDAEGRHEVATAEHLQIMQRGLLYYDEGQFPSDHWSASYIQTADIDLSDCHAKIMPIGNATTSFTGQYDGGHFKISNWSFTQPSDSASVTSTGLFGAVTYAEIKRVCLTGVWMMMGSDHASAYLGDGFLCGSAIGSTVYDISLDLSEGTLIGGGPTLNAPVTHRIGLVAGYVTNSVVSGATVHGVVDVKNYVADGHNVHVGGVVGYSVNAGSSIRLCRNLAFFPSGITGKSAGGIVGYIQQGTLEYCTNAMQGNVEGEVYGGGLEPETLYMIRLYVDNAMVFKVLVTTETNSAENYSATDFYVTEEELYDISEIGDKMSAAIVYEVFTTVDIVEVDMGFARETTMETTFVKKGELVEIDQLEAVLLPFDPSATESQESTIKLSDNTLINYMHGDITSNGDNGELVGKITCGDDTAITKSVVAMQGNVEQAVCGGVQGTPVEIDVTVDTSFGMSFTADDYGLDTMVVDDALMYSTFTDLPYIDMSGTDADGTINNWDCVYANIGGKHAEYTHLSMHKDFFFADDNVYDITEAGAEVAAAANDLFDTGGRVAVNVNASPMKTAFVNRGGEINIAGANALLLPFDPAVTDFQDATITLSDATSVEREKTIFTDKEPVTTIENREFDENDVAEAKKVSKMAFRSPVTIENAFSPPAAHHVKCFYQCRAGKNSQPFDQLPREEKVAWTESFHDNKALMGFIVYTMLFPELLLTRIKLNVATYHWTHLDAAAAKGNAKLEKRRKAFVRLKRDGVTQSVFMGLPQRASIDLSANIWDFMNINVDEEDERFRFFIKRDFSILQAARGQVANSSVYTSCAMALSLLWFATTVLARPCCLESIIMPLSVVERRKMEQQFNCPPEFFDGPVHGFQTDWKHVFATIGTHHRNIDYTLLEKVSEHRYIEGVYVADTYAVYRAVFTAPGDIDTITTLLESYKKNSKHGVESGAVVGALDVIREKPCHSIGKIDGSVLGSIHMTYGERACIDVRRECIKLDGGGPSLFDTSVSNKLDDILAHLDRELWKERKKDKISRNVASNMDPAGMAKKIEEGKMLDPTDAKSVEKMINMLKALSRQVLREATVHEFELAPDSTCFKLTFKNRPFKTSSSGAKDSAPPVSHFMLTPEQSMIIKFVAAVGHKFCNLPRAHFS